MGVGCRGFYQWWCGANPLLMAGHRQVTSHISKASHNILIYNFIITPFDFQGEGISARAFVLARPGVAPPLVSIDLNVFLCILRFFNRDAFILGWFEPENLLKYAHDSFILPLLRAILGSTVLQLRNNVYAFAECTDPL